LTGTLATEVKMCEIVHGRSLALPPTPTYRYNSIYRNVSWSDQIIFVYREIPI
jgi:hypothetical protein